MYSTPTLPFGRVDVVMLGGLTAWATVMRSWRVADWLTESVTRKEKSKLPVAVGVPEILPVGARETPGGSVPLAAAQVYGAVPPDAASV
jgi:hypothetical protein